MPQTGLSYGLCDGYAKSGVTIEHRDPDLELRDLPVEVSRHEALAEEFDAFHLRLCAASAVEYEHENVASSASDRSLSIGAARKRDRSTPTPNSPTGQLDTPMGGDCCINGIIWPRLCF